MAKVITISRAQVMADVQVTKKAMARDPLFRAQVIENTTLN